MPSRRACLFALITVMGVLPLGGRFLHDSPARAADAAILHVTSSGATHDFSLADLDAMPQAKFRTGTPWSGGVDEFSGVRLADLLKAVGAQGASLQLIALNDYVVTASSDELVKADALLSTRRDGEPMPISDKGPIFVIFPFDDRPELKHQAYFSRAVWQLDRIVVEP